MEITVYCKDMVVSAPTPYNSDSLHVTLDGVEPQKLADELIDNGLEGVSHDSLLDEIGVDNVSTWLKYNGYTVSED